MPRPRNIDTPQQIAVNVPQSIIERVDLLLTDPNTGRLHYGARSALITDLLRQWLAEQEHTK